MGQFLDIILVLVAVFIALRLRSSLGKKEDSDQAMLHKFYQMMQQEAKKKGFNLVKKPTVTDVDFVEKTTEETVTAPAAVLKKVKVIQLAYPQFSLKRFLISASKAFELIMEAFSEGKTEILRDLLDTSVYTHFCQQLEEQKKKGEKQEITLVSLLATEALDIYYDMPVASITVQFRSEQIYLLRDMKGNILAGNPSNVETVEDVWVFRRDLSTADPKWILVETRPATDVT